MSLPVLTMAWLLFGTVIALVASTITPSKTDDVSGKKMMQLRPHSQQIAAQVADTQRSLPAARTNLAASTDPELRKLAEYDAACKCGVVSRMLIFTELPSDVNSARDEAIGIASTLQTFAQYSITPVVILEPSVRGVPVDLKAFRAGAYDEVLKAYFAALHSSGISDQTLGMWVPMPEGNTPRWGDTDPTDFVANVTRTVSILRDYFPGGKASILLDSKTYESDDPNWVSGVYTSLLPYVQSIPKGMLDSVGLQGFPWVPPRGDGTPPIDDPSIYLSKDLIEAVANTVGTSNIWFNTGTFNEYYTDNAQASVSYSLTQREAILSSIAGIAQTTHKDGFRVSVNLFAADKSSQDEAIDWSYWHGTAYSTQGGQVFSKFAEDLFSQDTDLWIFDIQTK